LPITVSGSPRLASLNEPSPQAGAPCGLVDLLDFPLDPPDAASVSSGGGDFGVFRRRYDKYHAGEDWRGARRGSNFGLPVYSIGHGRVTYAAPLGWGRDQGVVIVRHHFADGDTFLSFYGHLDPDSVVLNAGDCVVRGEQVGQIGRPRSSPHLHFEIRHHMPAEPGPGYWPEDPTLAGWEPPSATIWGQRIGVSPGVQWTRPFVQRGSRGIGLLHQDTFIVIEERMLVAINVTDGSERWRFPDQDQVDNAMFDTELPLLYVANRTGYVDAYQIQDGSESKSSNLPEEVLVPIWRLELEARGTPTLMPLPGGGLVAAVGRELLAISAEGSLLWQLEIPSHPGDWAANEEMLLFSTSGRNGSLWSIDRSAELKQWAAIAGQPVIVGDQIFLYGETGVYRIDETAGSADLLYSLPNRFLQTGDMMALPAGGLLVAHTDLRDRRLILLNPDGQVRWDRSFAEISSGAQSLLMLAGQPYLLALSSHPGSSEYAIYWVDVDGAELKLIFSGGTRSPIPADTWAVNMGEDRFLLSIGGGHMLAFQPDQAIEVVFR
jgi:outer membrane protein assembly factor BamB